MTRKLFIGAALLLLVLGLTIFIFSRSHDEARPNASPVTAQQLEHSPPGPLFESLQKVEPTEELLVVLDTDGPRWLTAAGDELLHGPSLADHRPWQWSIHELQGWSAALGTYQDQDQELRATIWTSQNLGMAIIDIHARVAPAALATPLQIFTSMPATTSLLLTGELTTKELAIGDSLESILAIRRDDEHLPAHLFSPGQAAGKLMPDSSPDTLKLAWDLWPGIDAHRLCEPENSDDEQFISTNLRLIAQFGPQPLLIPLPASASAQALATPIFIDPPRLSENAWADGRARDALELARRIRALSFGHSNPEDPRYGNGGLLTNDFGATFAIPAHWWQDEPIAQLRRDLAGTNIGLLPQATHLATISDGPAPLLSSDIPCLELHTLAQNSPVILLHEQSSLPQSLSIAAALPPLLSTGKTSSHRDQLLDRIFQSEHPEALFVPGSYRLLAIPLIATRNPLEPIAEHALLTPERNGHWTLHDRLTREFSTWELESQAELFKAISLQGIIDERARHGSTFAAFTPEGSIEFHPTHQDLHYLSFLANGEIRVFEQAQAPALPPSSPTLFNLNFHLN